MLRVARLLIIACGALLLSSVDALATAARPRCASAMMMAADAPAASAVLRAGSAVVTPLLKPIYSKLAPLQAGSYDEAATRKEIEQIVKASPVVVYTYDLSPFCTEATALLDQLGAKYRVVSLGKEWIPGLIAPGGAATRAELGKMTGQTSLPHVFIGGKSVGGLFSGTPGLVPALDAGELGPMLKKARAL